MIWLKCLALIGCALFLYSYTVYPLVLALIAGCVQFKRDLVYAMAKRGRRDLPLITWPHVAIVIAAYNEQKHIRQRVQNLLDVDYPNEKITIYIGSDGSRDQTGNILMGFQEERLRAFVFDENRGKANVLNDLVSRGQEEIIVFSDANTFFSPDALKQLVQPFADPSIGCVSGELRLTSAGGDNQDGLYWRIEQFLKFFESRIGGLLGANGAIYAIRRSYWRPLRSDTICDDFCVAMNVSAAGGRLLYTPAAWAIEEMPESIDDEYQRRIRIGIGNFQALFRHPEYFFRTSAGTALSYVSHKVLRWVAPHLLLISLFASALLAYFDNAWLWWVIAQVVGFAIAFGAYAMLGRRKNLPSVVKLLAFLFALNFAFVIASWRFVSGNYSGSWRRTSR